jgi:hypothetical protein
MAELLFASMGYWFNISFDVNFVINAIFIGKNSDFHFTSIKTASDQAVVTAFSLPAD